MSSEYFDVVIVGAGLSGIGAACHLQMDCPNKSYAIIEARDAIGGTWDLFRYPGIRSDSDMHTLGYDFKPWHGKKAIADGPAILNYVREAAAEHDVEPHIRYGHRLVSARWSSDEACWTLEIRSTGGDAPIFLRCNMLLMCAGYYRYDKGHIPEFKGRERFTGEIIDPQHWPSDLDYSGKRIVVIGSGATAMTLVPELAKQADHVTMVQRSPTYVVSWPDQDWIANLLRKILPADMAYAITRWKNITLQQWIYRRTRTAPEKAKRLLLKRVRKELGKDYDVDKHFTPSYNPWDQRLCLVPNSDLFEAIRSGKASVVTDRIDTFTEGGLSLQSGEQVPADIIVTATGIDLLVLGDVQFHVDDKAVDFSQSYTYKGIMSSDVPNMVSTFGYINASWTLRADLTAEYFCRLVNYMDEHGFRQCTPRLSEEEKQMPAKPWITDFSSGYIQRVLPLMPRQGDHEPWVNPQSYKADRKMFLEAPLDDGALIFEVAGQALKPAEVAV